MIANTPFIIMGNFRAVGQMDGLGEINQPYTCLCPIVHKQQRTANNLVRLEEIGSMQSGPNGA